MRMSDDQWDSVLNINLKGSFTCTRSVIKYMMKKKSGRIINITSIVGLTDYSYETIQKDSETVHYEIKILNNKNEYFIVTWVFVLDECELSIGMCWQTIGVSPPMYFDSGI